MHYIITLTRVDTDATADPHSLRVKEAGESPFHATSGMESPEPVFSSYAVYKATGLGAYELYDEIEYDSWYSSQLLNELRIQDPRYSQSMVSFPGHKHAVPFPGCEHAVPFPGHKHAVPFPGCEL